MNLPYAEVIGDPITQSKSPIIHKHWLDRLNLGGEYSATRVVHADLADHLDGRRSDPAWRGCNVTIPHKEAVLAHIDELDSSAGAIGAVNCIVPGPAGLIGHNTDVDGVAAALGSTRLEGQKVAIVGAGGACRAALAYVATRNVSTVAVLARDPAKAQALRSLDTNAPVQIADFSMAGTFLEDSAVIINASPLGMAGCPQLPADLLSAVAAQRQATLFDMVYNPLTTRFLSVGHSGAIDGLTMLIGQAARAFELFFGSRPPPGDRQLRQLLGGPTGTQS